MTKQLEGSWSDCPGGVILTATDARLAGSDETHSSGREIRVTVPRRPKRAVAKSIREENIVNEGQDTIDDALDAALEMTFPASDPIAIFVREYDQWNDTTVRDHRTARASAHVE